MSAHKTTSIKEWGKQGSGDGQFNYPHGIAVGHDGNVYVADFQNHRIQCFDANGTFLFKWGKKGEDDGEFIFPSGLAISFNEANNVTNSTRKAMLMVPELSSYPWRSPNDSRIKSGLLSICVSYLEEQFIYVVDYGNHRIQVFGLDGSDNVKFIRKWGSKGIDDGQFQYPWACVIGNGVNKDNKFNMIYVTDSRNHRIQVFDHEGRFITKWGSRGSGDYQFNFPEGMCLSYSKNCSSDSYLAALIGQGPETSQSKISSTRSDSESKISARSESKISSTRPESKISARSESQMIYVVDTLNYRIVCYQIDDSEIANQMEEISELTGFINGVKLMHQLSSKPYSFLSPMNVMVDDNALDGAGVLYVVDYQDYCILKFTKDWKLIQTLGKRGSGNTNFNNPYGIAKGIIKSIDSESESNSFGPVSGTPVMYVADTHNNRIVTIKP